jgi:serine protease Do
MAMKQILPLCALLACLPCKAERPYVNDLAAPESARDLEAVETCVKAALPRARAATVCILIGEGSGTGVIVSADGLILSAAHVTAAVGKKVTVKMEDGTEHTATTLGLVADSDAAMAKLDGNGPFSFVDLERSGPPKLGDWVFALGHAGGFDKERGVVVRLGRLVRIAQNTLQSDGTLIGGDSGGPLFDLSGKLVGIHSRVGENISENMHVPMRVFTDHWEGMLGSEFIGEGPFATKPKKGNGLLGFASETRNGELCVTRVGKETPAAKAGIRVGDVILKCNGDVISERRQLQGKLKEMSVGDEVVLEIRRSEHRETIAIPLGER